jgi:uncharacterized protein (DUF885 family)
LRLPPISLSHQDRAATGKQIRRSELNDAVIREGPLPLDLLAGQIDQFIAKASN